MDDLAKSILIPAEIVMNKIFLIRGMKVMLDKDLAELYQVQTRNLNQAVNRNLKRFPEEDFMFQLTDDEFKNLMFQNGTSSWGGTRKLPYVFTELCKALHKSVYVS
ncbi:ORF6N domain-containing protein [Pedobacter sp. L105]|uniref:ORF6N domain-containing protein n=1 Tax=Pedobacter sp. L105 TaxID=1641871 RepID=UPI001C207866|nr:ORF6N domain-containing protein [Pedobacter sp. L105]